MFLIILFSFKMVEKLDTNKLFLDHLKARLDVKCSTCEGKGHKANYCGNIFALKSYFKVEGKNHEKDPMYMSFLKEKHDHLSKYNKEKIDNDDYEGQRYDFKNAVYDDENYIALKRILYKEKCNYCGGNGHNNVNCGTIWILNKTYNLTIYNKYWKKHIDKFRKTHK